jgi:peptidoglycan/xylan/chitin deacetylase (PgdA/CDA1 family)
LAFRLLDRIPNKRKFLARSLGALGVFRLLERISTRRWPALVVLTYHRIGSPGIRSNPYYDPVVSATPDAFRDQVRFLRERFSIVGLEEIARLEEAGLGSRTKPAALITFDDGYRDNFETALPILRELDVPAAFFIPTGFFQAPRLPWWDHVAYAIKQTRSPSLTLHREPEETAPLIIELGPEPSDQARTEAIMTVIRAFLDGAVHDETWFLAQIDRQAEVGIDSQARGRELFMDWGQVRQLASSGMSIGSHGHSHVALGGLGEDGQTRELAGSKTILESELGCEVTGVAYPFGWPGTFTARTTELAALVGYRLGFSSREGVNHPGTTGFERMALSRLNVGTGDSPSLLRARAALHGAFGKSLL